MQCSTLRRYKNWKHEAENTHFHTMITIYT